MDRPRLRPVFSLLVLLAAPAFLRAGPPDEVAALAARIDTFIDAGCAARKAVPAPPADDAEFLRRVCLDLAGRIPRASEVHAFLADPAPDKRRRLVDRLLAGPHYPQHFANVWRALLLPVVNDPQRQVLASQLEAWARRQLREGRPYDAMVRDLLTVPVGPPAEAVAFYQGNEWKPENLAAATSRLFLGVRLECAQCHDHPFARWKRTQFWEYAAFFAGLRSLQPDAGPFAPGLEEPGRRAILVPNSERIVPARFLDGKEPAWEPEASSRATLAGWVTRADNPWFARAAVNRLWAHFFGIGLADPVDELGEDNPASHPELLDELARAFAGHGFDTKFLIRALTASRAYQRTSARTDPSQEDPRLFARMALKGLTPEQLFDSLAAATGYREGPPRAGNPPGTPRAEFLARFAAAGDRRTEQPTSILQALALMNGNFLADATSVDRSETLAALLDAPFLDDRERLDGLFVAALARPMRPHEASRLTAYVAQGDSRKALADVFWALLNSSEFFLNH
jgi:hypothetical protein